MKSPLYPLLVLAALTAAQSAHAQQGGVTILRGQSSDQPRQRHARHRRAARAQRRDDRRRRRRPGLPCRRAAAAQPIGEGTGIIPPPAPSETAQALSGSAKPLTPAEAAALAAALKAVDESRWADARAAVANFRNTLLDRYVEWSILRVAPKTEAAFANTWRFLRESPTGPSPRCCAARPRTASVPRRRRPRSSATSRPSRRSPAPATCAAWRRPRRRAPTTCKKFASDSWRSATFRNADENEFLNRYGHLLSGEDQIARFDRLMLEGKAPVARELAGQAAARLPAARQCAAGDGDDAQPMP